jgi:ketosteroid isomerase-like protein
MKCIASFATGWVVWLALMVNTSPHAATADIDSGFRQFLPRFEEGTRRFISGDAGLWEQNASHSEDATLMEAWGAYEKGWKQLAPRYGWAVARFQKKAATLQTEYLASGVSGDLAYTVTIERSTTVLVGQDAPRSMTLRVSNVFRREEGAWKLVHRHTDPLTEKTAPGTVLQK